MKHFNDHVFALTGGIATGKSTVAAMFKDLGAYIVDTDLIAKKVVEPGMPAIIEIKKHFGDSVFDNHGHFDRGAMKKKIIKDPETKNLLNSIMHPYILNMTIDETQKRLSEKKPSPIIIDVPLLYEAGWQNGFKSVILVFTSRDIQLKRLMKRDVIDQDMAQGMLSIQMDIKEKKGLADYLIDNSFAIDSTRKQVNDIFAVLMERCKKQP